MPTHNHGLNTPPEGTTDWHVPLNENFSSLDSILQNVSTDGTSHTPSTLTADEITLNGVTRTSWGESALHTTDTAASGKVIVAETADDIQPAIDALDGEQSGQSGGTVRLLPKAYTIDKEQHGSITLKTGVNIVGSLYGFNISPSKNDWACTSIKTANFSAGDDLFTSQAGNDRPENVTIAQLHVDPNGTDLNVFRLRNSIAVHFQYVMIEDCQGNGIVNEGAQDTSAQGCQIQAGNLDNDKFSVKVIKSSRHGGQMAYNGTLDFAKLETGNTLKISGGGGLRAFIKGPPTNSTPAAMVQVEGGSFELTDAIIDGNNDSGLHGLRAEHNIKLDNVTIQKTDKGLIQNDRGSLSQYDNLKVMGTVGNGIEITGASPQMNSVRVTGAGGDGIVTGNVNPSNTWSNLFVENCNGHGLNLSKLAVGKRIRVRGADIRGVGGRQINGLDHVVFNGLAQESASAAEPQDSYRRGEVVDFTDTRSGGDASGLYQVLLDGETFRRFA